MLSPLNLASMRPSIGTRPSTGAEPFCLQPRGPIEPERRQTGTGARSKAALISCAGDNIKGVRRRGHSDPQPMNAPRL